MASYDFIVKNGLQAASANIVANSSGIYVANTTGVVNASSFTVGTSYSANSTVVNAVAYNISTSFIANTTGAYHTGTVNAASHTVGSSFVANSTTLNSNGFIANSTGAYVSGKMIVGGGTPGTDSSSIRSASDIYLDANTSSMTWNLYYNSGWFRRNIGPGFVWRNDGSGLFELYYAANGTAGSSASVSSAIQINASSGSVTFSSNVTSLGVISSSSDERLKTDIKIIDSPLDKITAMNGITFKFTDTDVISTGLIAQEVEKVLPEAVSINENGMKFVAYGNLVGLLVESIKELKKEVEELKNGRIN